ncbi:MAG: A/G-specific adenine glycosylase, partial [Sphingobacteriia bacterium]|nr:A/G-specific adenine glycosylase [Sphingobacteriia bacterium]
MRQQDDAKQKTERRLLKYKILWTKGLLEWYAVHGRDLPWRRTRDPYAIWLSEVLLQQTRVEQGTSYYLRFLAHFPTVQDLAKADIQDVLRLWQGLGYYRRAHLLHSAAKLVVERGGGLPQSPAEWLQLPGVGPYTAAAIASIALDYPEPVVDGNVIRVLSRAFGAEAPYDTAEGMRWIRQTAQELLDTSRPGDYNQALMDMGAIICTPQKPA